MAGDRQRDPQPPRPERAQPPQREGESDRPGLAGQRGDTVRGIVPRDVMRGVIGRDKSGNEGVSPRGEPS